MKLYQIIIILIVFFKTETLFSKNELFNVNNIQLEKNEKISNKAIANLAIKKGFNQLINRILLNQDVEKVSDLNLSSIKELVKFYQITNVPDEKKNDSLLNFNVTFDKEKIHNLFYERAILYSEIPDKELYILPIFIKDEEIFVFNKNFFYENWSKIYEGDLVEFILPLENIEIIKNINDNRDNLISLNLDKVFQEYSNKNLALVLIEENKNLNKKVYIKTLIQGKKISKSINFKIKKKKLSDTNHYEKIISEVNKELINLIKSNNLIDIRTPSFLSTKLDLNKKSNLVELKVRLKNIDTIENIYVQEFNKEYMNLRIKYLGKLEKLINELKKENIELRLVNDRWVIKTL